MTTMMAPMCYACRHFINDPNDYPKCAAFPENIPNRIVFWEADHRVSQPGDNGIVFEQDPTEPDFDHETADEVFRNGQAESA